ncbi:hypothetical protein HN954_02980 [bacterium]|jgi:hypothetical protein|nr:hypothetical protein [bacterium]MBT6831903.1 hypothetical protein [bacterium]MBT6996368.1 hypothetical protein [bacterium]MBT7772070.1 hypothetical protein [bacterium]
MNEPRPESLEKKVDRLEQKLDQVLEMTQKIKRKVDPPWWLGFLRWVRRNWLQILMFLALAWMIWQVLEIVRDVLTAIENLKNFPGEAKNSVIETMKSWKFW